MTPSRTLTTRFDRTEQPGWTCSHCRSGQLVISMKQLLEKETPESKATQEALEDYAGYEKGLYRFAGLAVCNNCADPASVAGEIQFESDGENASSTLVPRFIDPAPQIIRRPKKLSSEVGDALTRSEALFWSDEHACANAIRTVIEAVLTNLGVKRFFITKKRRRVPLSLHDRISEYERKGHKDIASMMLAVKWIGNAGSHAGQDQRQLKKDDLFDGFDMIEHVLENLYGTEAQELEKRARKILKAKGPLSGRRVLPKRREF